MYWKGFRSRTSLELGVSPFTDKTTWGFTSSRDYPCNQTNLLRHVNQINLSPQQHSFAVTPQANPVATRVIEICTRLKFKNLRDSQMLWIFLPHSVCNISCTSLFWLSQNVEFRGDIAWQFMKVVMGSLVKYCFARWLTKRLLFPYRLRNWRRRNQ